MGDTELSKQFSGTKVGALNNKLNSTMPFRILAEWCQNMRQNSLSKQIIILSLLRWCIVFQDPRMFQALKCCPLDHKITGTVHLINSLYSTHLVKGNPLVGFFSKQLRDDVPGAFRHMRWKPGRFKLRWLKVNTDLSHRCILTVWHQAAVKLNSMEGKFS